MGKRLVVYFSHKGENYSKGRIVNLEKGNSAEIGRASCRERV